MGNSDSHYSLQGPKSGGGGGGGGGFILPGKQKACSLRFRAVHAKDEHSRSPHGWGRGGGAGGPGYKSRALARGCLSQHKGGQPYVPRHYDYVTKGGRTGAGSKHGTSPPARGGQASNFLLVPENGFPYAGGERTGNRYVAAGERNGHVANGHGTPEQVSLADLDGDQSSPKVLIKTLGRFDGATRVEFTNTTNNNKLAVDDSGGPVQLLKYSPAPQVPADNPEILRRHSLAVSEAEPSLAPADAGLRASKGSSLSSECSWYDSPWGNGAELSDADNASSSARTADAGAGEAVPPGDQRLLGRRASPVSLQDLYRDAGLAATFPAAKELSSRYLGVPCGGGHRASFVSTLDVAAQGECPGSKQYASYTLPCRRSKPIVEGSAKKDTLKSRMRRISDWTGSLSRKKRKLQEPKSKDASECCDSGIDGLTADTSSPSQGSSLLWSPGSGQAPPARSESASALPGAALRQNIYENFMRELEAGRGGGGGGDGSERPEPSTETEETSSDSAGSLEQLDLLFEKEQGVVRKAGWLCFKPLVTLPKERKLELAPRRKWKQYWVTLKGCTLLFYETYGKNSMEQDLSPRYALFAEDSIVQSVPEHPKKENVFCLSNTFGDVYLFQATSQTDLENWVTAIHSASASLFAKRQGKEDTVRLLRSQTRSLAQKIDMDGKMKKMAELQLSIVSDPKNRKAIENQIQQWEQNLEKFNMDLFRMRCYLASLQGGELPNPKSLLAAASRPSKVALSRLGIFSVSSFHALICSRDEAMLRKRSLSLSQRVRSKRGLFSSLKGLDSLTKRGKEKRPSVSQRLDGSASLHCTAPLESSHWDTALETPVYIYMPDNQAVTVPIKQDHMVVDVLSLACKKKQLDPGRHCLRLRRTVGQNVELSTPASNEFIQDLVYDELEIIPLNLYQLLLSRSPSTVDFGFAVTGHVDGFRNSRIFVSEVLPDGVASSEGLRPGDEILVLNGRSVSTLDLGLIQTLFSEQALNMTLRRDSPSGLWQGSAWPAAETRDPAPPFPPPGQFLEDLLESHTTPPSAGVGGIHDGSGTDVGSSADDAQLHLSPGPQTEHHRKSVETVCSLYHSFQDGPGGAMDGTRDASEPALRPCPRHMSATERLRKVIQELVDTEKSYVKDLTCLFEIYLKPLQNETFLTQDEMESLFGSLPEMLDFQKVFLQTLEERISSSPDFSTLETPLQFKKLLFSLGGSFLYYADHFKLYSGFCANHIKVQKVLERAKTDRAFKEFLDAKNPTKQHSSTLESYLIKPVQRVLKYPLLLRELVSLTDGDSEEHYHLTEALKAMEKVASHINEMQKIYEDYGTVFDQLVAEQSGAEKEVTEISMGEFLMHSSVVWLNPFPSLGRMRKDPELTVFVFKKAVILVYRESCKLKKKMHTNARSAFSHGDLDPFKFRWLIPLSALQVRLGNSAGTETNCIWELIHTKSEIEGRPETIFQLCSSVPESKASTVKAIRSVLRENVRRNLRCEQPAERACRERLVLLRNPVPTSARIGSSRASWLCKHPSLDVTANELLKGGQPDSDEGSLSSGTQSSHTPEGPPDPRPPAPRASKPAPAEDGGVKESDILSDDDEFCEGAKREPPTGAGLEAQLRRLKLAEEEEAGEEDRAPAPRVRLGAEEPEDPEGHPKLVRAHFGPIKRKGNSLRRTRGILQTMKEHSRSLDSQSEGTNVDLNALLEREFSVQSLASVVNEDCFYEAAESQAAQTVPTL
ncbi:rho guanine nucleotide exchange factor TIAM2 isoform X2 [Lepisosteus oculatus]|uniref:rho guanine nucleotide exchange factor TIAM2 isoform X2 n=1 Tax=Lepisosteus oculatus TaxID=7918 RepID=UPI0035F50E08